MNNLHNLHHQHPQSSQKIDILSKFIVNHYNKLRKESNNTNDPLVVGLSGAQGCGKTTIVKQIVQYLKSAKNLSVVNFSMDDFYLTYEDQCQLANQNPGNQLLEFRGAPGTHDVLLGRQILQELRDVQQKYSERLHERLRERDNVKSNNVSILIPFYDKSLRNGRGDRAPIEEWIRVSPPFDIILFDGWSLGFKHLPSSELQEAYDRASSSLKTLKSHSFSHIKIINEHLKRYEENWYPFLDIFIHVEAENINYVYQWRLEQEHSMKQRGKSGMSDEQVKDFVNKFMPAYELYLERLSKENFFSKGDKGIYGSHLKLVMNREREIIKEILI
ncbi:5754_t:CDS:2 [Funneliformis caledonium]|uniref:5754_t:CDS:1 n=1 Tax=Funneliformis caledonium TaxID=1117310 RepID=A0A9N9FSB8_9GLOM|nr:5754_t:CDS:2 [Funneliformis caledonium]